MFKDKNDRPLIAVVAVLAVVAVMAWPKGATIEAVSPAAASTHVASQPADYDAPPLNGTTATPVPKANTLVDIVRDPTDLPPPVGNRGPRRVTVHLTAIEVTGTLNSGATYHYWTFNGKVPGPMIRVRVGDIVDVRLTNDPNSMMMHNVDFHAVIGTGGGSEATLAGPGETKGFEFKAEHAGLFVYHCAVMPVAQHIASGMYGMILVEPAGGLPKVDREFYVMQGEIYTKAPFGAEGLQEESYDKLMAEQPEYYVFNGAVGALTTEHPLHAKVGDTVRIFFGVGGPDKTSSFHVIGEVMDHVYPFGSLTSAPLTGIQTVTVPPGSATVVDFQVKVPGTYTLVDHAITRVERGLVGKLKVDGPEQPGLFKPLGSAQSATN